MQPFYNKRQLYPFYCSKPPIILNFMRFVDEICVSSIHLNVKRFGSKHKFHTFALPNLVYNLKIKNDLQIFTDDGIVAHVIFNQPNTFDQKPCFNHYRDLCF